MRPAGRQIPAQLRRKVMSLPPLLTTRRLRIIQPDPAPAGVPKWKTTVLVADDGTLFIPAMLAPRGELRAFLRAGWDGQPRARWHGHLFVPLDWMAEKYPAVRAD